MPAGLPGMVNNLWSMVHGNLVTYFISWHPVLTKHLGWFWPCVMYKQTEKIIFDDILLFWMFHYMVVKKVFQCQMHCMHQKCFTLNNYWLTLTYLVVYAVFTSGGKVKPSSILGSAFSRLQQAAASFITLAGSNGHMAARSNTYVAAAYVQAQCRHGRC